MSRLIEMTPVSFTVEYDFDAAPQVLWSRLVDWGGHGDWIPATRMEVGPGDPTDVGADFTAFTGVGPLVLEDRMRVARCVWSVENHTGECEIEKLGPKLWGTASFSVAPAQQGSRVVWREDVAMARLPRPLAPVAALLGATGFRIAMWRLARQL